MTCRAGRWSSPRSRRSASARGSCTSPTRPKGRTGRSCSASSPSRRRRRFAPLVAGVVALTGATASATAAPARPAAFTGWAGYLGGNPHPYLTGTVNVPPLTSGSAYLWDGATNAAGALVQVGVNLQPGTSYDFAWWATCPYRSDPGTNCVPQTIGYVTPGDRITLAVNHLGGNRWRVSIWDHTGRWAVWHALRYPPIPNPEGAWILEYGPAYFRTLRWTAPTEGDWTYGLTNRCIHAPGRMTITGCGYSRR